MKQFIYVPTHLKTNRILPGHGHTARGTDAPIPGADHRERRARRTGWTEKQAHRRHVYGTGNGLALVGAMLALMISLFAAMGPSANVLDRPATEPTTELVDTAPTAPVSDAVRPS